MVALYVENPYIGTKAARLLVKQMAPNLRFSMLGKMCLTCKNGVLIFIAIVF